MRSPMWATEQEMVNLLTSVSLWFVGVGRCERGRRIERQEGTESTKWDTTTAKKRWSHSHDEEGGTEV